MDQGSLRRVAVLLDSLDQVTATQLLAKMPPSRAAQVRYAISQLSGIDPLERKMAIADFMQKSQSVTTPRTPPVHSEPVVAAAHTTTASPAEHSADEEAESHDPLHFLNEMPIRALVSALSDEHPQTVAIVLASMQPAVAAKLLGDLPTAVCKSAIQRLAAITEIPSQAIQEISEHLQGLMKKVMPAEPQAGSRSLASILTHLDLTQREQILTDLATDHPELVASLPPRPLVDEEIATPEPPPQLDETDSMAIDPLEVVDELHLDLDSEPTPIDFAPIERLPADALRRVLLEVEVDTAILALCGMDPRVVQRLLAILPRNQRREVQGLMRQIDNVELRQIDASQRELYDAAMQLHDAGKLPELHTPTSSPSQMSFAA
ncbi:Flagellar motor switch protein FliG [Rosistilla carotiformis]|uniref:Flagellar motor switch protein FliG n=1 Tax=Rosistilla carotiformis TaxID=2528017 RepID=A0A518JN02_9BACT|nr:FliG C-terminal domain-containing protein [Rosistilla carotiformis]QDV66934.1 Flagellar motor switch protein FliG [Rosistilla carotiformis]